MDPDSSAQLNSSEVSRSTWWHGMYLSSTMQIIRSFKSAYSVVM